MQTLYMNVKLGGGNTTFNGEAQVMAQGHIWRSLSALTLSHGSGNDNFTLWAVLELCALRNENGLVGSSRHEMNYNKHTYSIYL